MTEISDKNKTNRKWTSSDKYKDTYDKIFGKKDDKQQDKAVEPETKDEV
jgi:hypothetical protein